MGAASKVVLLTLWEMVVGVFSLPAQNLRGIRMLSIKCRKFGVTEIVRYLFKPQPLPQWPLRLFAGVLVVTAAVQAWGKMWQSEAGIRQVAEQFIASQPAVKKLAAADITTQPLHKHLQLPICDQALAAFLPPGANLLGNTTAGVRCGGGNPWTVYVPVSVVAYGEVPTASRSLARGTTLGPQDLVLTKQPLHLLPNNSLTELDDAIGKEVTRPIAAGTLLTNHHIREPDLVGRGQQVTLIAGEDGYEIRVAGKALANGALGERIRVRNISSRRIVEGTIEGPGIIRIEM